ncbi:MAG: LPS translocon maturation chaperone LptM [Methylophagaceae bacterium]|jgi:predicted small lipoprotein YifL
MQKFNYYTVLLAFILLVGLTGGCGQKGNLYLPDTTVIELGPLVN